MGGERQAMGEPGHDFGDYGHLPELSLGHAVTLCRVWPTLHGCKRPQAKPKAQPTMSQCSIWDVGQSQRTSHIHPRATLQRQERPALRHHIRTHQDREKSEKRRVCARKKYSFLQRTSKEKGSTDSADESRNLGSLQSLTS